jgi:hypothetical protein
MPHTTDIDEIDAKILKTLLCESRTSFTEIAKDCKISDFRSFSGDKVTYSGSMTSGSLSIVNISTGHNFVVTFIAEKP